MEGPSDTEGWLETVGYPDGTLEEIVGPIVAVGIPEGDGVGLGDSEGSRLVVGKGVVGFEDGSPEGLGLDVGGGRLGFADVLGLPEEDGAIDVWSAIHGTASIRSFVVPALPGAYSKCNRGVVLDPEVPAEPITSPAVTDAP